jgi:hypothetical protein
MSLNDSRFDSINKSPEVMTNIPRVPGFNFNGQKDRPHLLFGKTETGSFYDTKTSITKPRSDCGVPRLRGMQPRGSHSIMHPPPMSCINAEKAVDAKTYRFKPKQLNLTNMKATRARDDSILKTNDRWYNNQLENTRDER